MTTDPSLDKLNRAVKLALSAIDPATWSPPLRQWLRENGLIPWAKPNLCSSCAGVNVRVWYRYRPEKADQGQKAGAIEP